MTDAPTFDEPVDAPRCILQLMTEMGLIEIWASSAGFRLNTDDQTPMLDDEPGIIRESAWLDWDSVWAAVDRYKWARFAVRIVDSRIVDEVQARARAQLAQEPDGIREFATTRWNDSWLDMLERG